MLRPNELFAIVAVDIVTVTYPSMQKQRYFTLFTDLCTLFRYLFTSKYKKASSKYIKYYYTLIKTQYKKSVGVYRIDRGGKYGGNSLIEFAREEGTILQVIAPYSSIQNGKGEVSNYIVCTTTRKIIVDACLPRYLQSETVPYTIYLLNLILSLAIGNDKSLQQLVNEQQKEQKPQLNLEHLRTYGCQAILLNYYLARGTKFDTNSIRGQLVGYDSPTIYRIQVRTQNTVIRTKDIRLYELEEELLRPLDKKEEDLEIVLYEHIFQVERNRIDGTNPDEDAVAIATGIAANPGVVERIPDGK